MKTTELLTFASLVLLVIGGFNLGLMGLFGFDLLHAIFGGFLSRLFFVLIGVAAGYYVYARFVKKIS